MINTTIGKYKLKRLIGEGGMASVYEGEHEMLGTKVAIKLLNPILSNNAQIKERFRNEAKVMASLDHPNIVGIRGWSRGRLACYENGKFNAYFLIMDRLEETLQDRICTWRTKWRKEQRPERNNKAVLLSWMKKVFRGRRMNREQPTNKQQNSKAIDALLVDRLSVAWDISSALKYLHDRHQYEKYSCDIK